MLRFLKNSLWVAVVHIASHGLQTVANLETLAGRRATEPHELLGGDRCAVTRKSISADQRGLQGWSTRPIYRSAILRTPDVPRHLRLGGSKGIHLVQDWLS